MTLAARGYSRNVHELGVQIGHPDLYHLVRLFLRDRLSALNPDTNDLNANYPELPDGTSIFKYPSAVATFHAPSDLSGLHGMHRERIYATAAWRGGPSRSDCVFLGTDSDELGFRGLQAARVLLFFSFKYSGCLYPCAMIHWFSPADVKPCDLTGMWIVEPDFHADGTPAKAVVHLDCILRNAHLIGVAGVDYLLRNLEFHQSLDAFRQFYVNKYADHHSHEIAF